MIVTSSTTSLQIIRNVHHSLRGSMSLCTFMKLVVSLLCFLRLKVLFSRWVVLNNMIDTNDLWRVRSIHKDKNFSKM